jgi:hypothetical protein
LYGSLMRLRHFAADFFRYTVIGNILPHGQYITIRLHCVRKVYFII